MLRSVKFSHSHISSGSRMKKLSSADNAQRQNHLREGGHGINARRRRSLYIHTVEHDPFVQSQLASRN